MYRNLETEIYIFFKFWYKILHRSIPTSATMHNDSSGEYGLFAGGNEGKLI